MPLKFNVLLSLSSTERRDGRWNQGSRMTSWFDVSAHDLHGQIALGGQQQDGDSIHEPVCGSH